jgi:diketogulonate reductase-like aldo/keto reductase
MARGIRVEAYSPLMNGHLSEEPKLAGIAAKYGKTAAQLALRWTLQNGVICIPKSVHANRILENAAIFDFEISPADMKAIDGLNRNHRFLPDPDAMNYV